MSRYRSVSLATGLVAGAALVVTGAILSRPTVAQSRVTSLPVTSALNTVKVPEPPSLHRYVKNRKAAIQLGKALFWDMQVGSDGVQACGTCHFHAGADSRLKNQLSPGILAGDTKFEAGKPNSTLSPSDFPFTKNRPGHPAYEDSNDVCSSQGVVLREFVDIVPGSAVDKGKHIPDPVFNVNGVNVRRSEPRNTPTVFNAVYNHRNFWDGRAHHEFNGVNPFGDSDTKARVLQVFKGKVQLVKLGITNCSLASQAVGPPLSDREMSWAGRTLPKVGKKLIGDYGNKQYPLVPLGRQLVHPNDSVLGPIANSRTKPGAKGLDTTYKQMIQEAFDEQWWNSDKIFKTDKGGRVTEILDRPQRDLTTDEYTMMEANFSLIFGLAVQLYMATLVSDDSPFDRFRQGDCNALTQQQLRGVELFFDPQGARCFFCHAGPEFTDAAVAQAAESRIERMRQGTGENVVYDRGFYNIGVRPAREDLGVGDRDPFGNPLSFTLLAQEGKIDLTAPDINGRPIIPGVNIPDVHGNFKAPSVRNVELTGPYFHNGGKATLEQVVSFYNRRGDFGGLNAEGLHPGIQQLQLLESDRKALEAFLVSLTDDRVRYQKAPFDHPQILVPNGHPGDEYGVTDDGTGVATDDLLDIPAVGAEGGPALQPILPQ
jgi:cytochrome c peroxidase